jgi:hypothetical protein
MWTWTCVVAVRQRAAPVVGGCCWWVHTVGVLYISRLLDDKRDREGVRCVVHGSRPDGLTLHVASPARELQSSSSLIYPQVEVGSGR